MADNIPLPTVDQLIADLHEVDWYSLGVTLGVHVSKLQEIKTQGGPSQWKIDMFAFWLRSTPTASWNDITRALEKLDYRVLAAKLNSKYSGQQPSLGTEVESLTRPTPEDFHPRVEVIEKLRNLESDFSQMLIEVRRLYANCDLMEVQFFFDDLVGTKEFENCDTIGKVLHQLRERYVDTFNTYYLEQLADHFQRDGMDELIKRYNQRKEEFLSDTKVLEFLLAIASRVDPKLPREMAAVTITIPEQLASDRTLKDMERLAGKAFGPYYRSFVSLYVKIGSIIITWFVPKPLIAELKRLSQKNVAVFTKERVQEVTIAGSVVFSQQDLQMILLAHFQECYQKTWHSLKEEIESNRVNAREVAHYLRYQHQLQMESGHEFLLEALEKQLEIVKKQLESGISWFNSKPLEGVAEEFLFDNGAVIILWRDYRALLDSYTNRRLEEYRGYDLGAPHSRDRKILKLKLDTTHREMKLSDIYELQDTINRDLGDCRLVLYLAAVQQGELELHCPSSVCYDMLTLRAEEKEKLKKAGIAEVACPDEQECLQPKNIIRQEARTSSVVTAGMRWLAGSPVLSVENRSETDILLVLKQSGTRETFVEIKREEKLEIEVTRNLFTSIMVFGMEKRLDEHLRLGRVNMTRLWMMALEGVAGVVLLATILGAPLGFVLLSDSAQRILGIRDNSPFSSALVDNTLATLSAEGEMVVSQGSYTMMQGNMSTVICSSWKPVLAEKFRWVSSHHKAQQTHFSHCLKLDFKW